MQASCLDFADIKLYMNKSFFLFFAAIILLTISGTALAQSPLPLIPRLDSRDIMFRQYQADVEAARRHLFSPRRSVGEAAGFLTIYSYLVQEEDSLLRIAARSNIPIAALASLNRLSHAEDLKPGMLILLPSMPGIFVPQAPASDLERLIGSQRPEDSPGILLSIPRNGQTERFMFIPGDDFTPTERVFFLNRGFRFPLRTFRVTSLYGPRISPITGREHIHRGIDLAAPQGTPVYAVRAGTVTRVGYDGILGNYIIIAHDNNWVSLYGHLYSINTSLNETVQSGSFIGRVGSTGLSTGPHLHFELLQNGRHQDPARLFGITGARGNRE